MGETMTTQCDQVSVVGRPLTQTVGKSGKASWRRRIPNSTLKSVCGLLGKERG